MADARKCITMQRNLGASVSAAGQGEKAGPQASSSSDRSSTLVGDLATVESNATRKQRTGILPEHTCESEHNVFCRVYSKFEVSSLRKVIDDRIREIYKDIFGFNMDESGIGRWAPNIICNSCRKIFDRWSQNKNRQSVKFSRPAIWGRPSSIEDCFYCCNIIRGYSNKNKSKIVYHSVSSVIAPVSTSIDDKITNDANDMRSFEIDANVMDIDEVIDMEVESESDAVVETDSDTEDGTCPKKPRLISQAVLNDLVRSLGLPKDGSEFLASFLKERNLLEPKTKVTFYRNREMKFRRFFTKDEEHSLVYCTNIHGLMNGT